MRSRRFDDAYIAYLWQAPVVATLDALEVYWKCNMTLKSLKDKATVRVHVSLDGTVVELLAAGSKRYDTQTKQGGGGAIDLAIYLLRLDFVSAVKRLQAIPAQPSAIA